MGAQLRTAHRNHEPCEKCGQVHPKCTGHNRSGGPCGNHPQPGQTVCRTHGGKAPQSQRKGQQRHERELVLAQASREMEAAGVEDISAEEHMEACLYDAAFKHKLYDLAVERLESEEGALTGSISYFEAGEDEREELRVVVEDPTVALDRHGMAQMHPLYQERDAWADRHFKFAKDCVAVGISKRRVQIQEASAHMVAGAFRATLADAAVKALMPPELASVMLDVFAGNLKALPVATPS